MTKLNKLPALKPMNCVIYTRVSSDLQISNYSLDTQEDLCRNYAEKQGYKILKVFREEGESAKTADRPVLIELLDYCRDNHKKINSVLVYRFDRAARSTQDHLAIKARLAKYGVRLESTSEPIDDSPTGRFLEIVIAANAQLDNEVRAEKTRNGLYKQFKAGITTRVPLGFKVGDVMGKRAQVEDEETYDRVRESWYLMNTGTRSLNDMANEMNRMGLLVKWGKKQKKITKQYANKLFRNIFYIGYLPSKKYQEQVKGIHKPMISEQVFYHVQDILDGRNNQPISQKRLVNNPLFPLRGIIKCDVCGKNLTAGRVKGRSKHYRKYWCTNNCITSVSSKRLLRKLNRKLAKIQPNQDLVNAFSLILKVKYEGRISKLMNIKEQADKKISDQKEMMTLLVRGHMQGKYPDDIFEQEKLRIEDNILSAQIVANDNLIEKYDIEKTTNFIRALFKDLKKAYKVSDQGQKKVLLGSIYPTGLMFNGKALLNRSLGAGFEAINDLNKAGYKSEVPFSALKFTRIEPILKNFQALILAYPNYEQQFKYV